MKNQRLYKALTALVIVALAVAVLPVTPARAAALIVNSNGDTLNNGDGVCTLREAITNANADANTWTNCGSGSGADTITFSGAVTTITLASALPNITDVDGLVIDGGGDVVVDGGGAFRIFQITSGAITIQSITLTNGQVNGSGGAIYNNGGTSLTINSVVFTSNRTVTTAGNDGGAIYHLSGVLNISNSTFTGNYTEDKGGAIYITNGSGTINGSIFNSQNNAAINDGAAIYMSNGTLAVNGSTFGGNVATGDGGAIYVNAGTLTAGDISGNTFNSNSANYGGAIYHNSSTLLTVANSTFNGNMAVLAGGDGGAIMLDANGSSAVISGSSFTSNSAGDNGGAIFNDGEPFTVTTSTFTSNTAGNGASGGANGGAFRNSAQAGNSTVSLSTFKNNSITMAANQNAFGGAIANDGVITIANTTFSGNSLTRSGAGTRDALGGAIYAGGTTTVHNVTMYGNTTSESGTGVASGGSIYSVGGVMTIANSIAADGTENGAAGNCGGTITNGGNNVDFNGGDCGFAITANPNLGALTGSPQYFPLNTGSSAIDTGNNAICVIASTTNNQSQNGLTRPLDGDGDTTATCDIGSYETPAVVIPTLSITNSPVTYNGSPQAATVTCSSGGAVSNILYNGSSTAMTNVGSYAVTANCAAVSGYSALIGASAGNFVINPATPTASITNSPVTYNGLPQTATVACSGGGIATLASGGTGTNVGSYPATVDCAASANYNAAAGLSAGDFTIAPASQIITVVTGAPSSASNGATFDVEANASSGLLVTITTSGSCTGGDVDGTATITVTSGSGACNVFYNQSGNANYAAATQIQQSTNATEGPSFTSANNTSFDFGFPGSFTVTAVGNPSLMTITLGGPIPAGVSLTNNGNGTETLSSTAATPVGVYNLLLTADNGVAPNATQVFTLTVRNGPIVSPNGINSTPDTGDGKVSENESIIDTLGITKLTVEFSQDVYDDPTDALDYGHDATNPANYILVRSATGIFATIDCAGGVVAPDINISVDSVSYSNGGGAGPFVSTLSINGGFPLNVVGFYRLYVCGTTSIVDANNRGLELAGNGTTPGTDYLRNFRVATAVVNGGNGNASSSSKKIVVTNGFLTPVTGFAPNQITTLPAQPADKVYTSMGQMTIEIPTLGVKYPIVGASITNKTWDLTWLKDSVAYLEGSAYPTTAGNTVLTAHVQDANKNLGPFSDIKGMELGQKIYIHVNEQVYVYQVQENSKISSNNIEAMFKHEEDSWITLVTCEDYNAKTGVYSNRRMVRAVLISVVPER